LTATLYIPKCVKHFGTANIKNFFPGYIQHSPPLHAMLATPPLFNVNWLWPTCSHPALSRSTSFY